MRNVCNVLIPHAMDCIISGIGIVIAVADSIGYWAPARYRYNLHRAQQYLCAAGTYWSS